MKLRFEKILRAEANAILGLSCHAEIEEAVQALVKCKGRVFTTGLGKAGYVAKKEVLLKRFFAKNTSDEGVKQNV